MKANSCNSFATPFNGTKEVQPKRTTEPELKSNTELDSAEKSDNASTKKTETKTGFLDKFEAKMINSADLNDTIKVPRTIFKGYLAFFAGTVMSSVAAIAKNKHKHTANALNIASGLALVYGTFSFVRPYIFKGANKEIKG